MDNDQDKELREAVDNTIEPHLQEFKAGHTGTVADNLVALIKSREERLVREARMNELDGMESLTRDYMEVTSDADFNDFIGLIAGRRAYLNKNYDTVSTVATHLTKSQEKS